MVSLNYRLGLLGWGAFVDDTTGKLITNLGLQDQQLALGTHCAIYLQKCALLLELILLYA